jgi:oligopeptide transport system substrate-binding protein
MMKTSTQQRFLTAMALVLMLGLGACTTPAALPPATALPPAGAPTAAAAPAAVPTEAPAAPAPAPTGAAAAPAPAAAAPVTVRYGLPALPVTWDISKSTGSHEYHVLRNTYEPLFDYDFKTFELQPRGALSFEISPDGTVYTYKLNPEAKWSDGKPVTAHDYVYGLMRLIDPTLASPMSYELDMVKGATDYYGGKGRAEDVGIKALDDTTLEITLTSPQGYFPIVPTSVWFTALRKDIVDAHPNDWMFPPYMVGNGPYYITQYTPDQKVVIEKNPYYYRQHGGPDKVEFNVYTDPAGSFRAYEAGEIDYSSVPSEEIQRVQGDAKMGPEYHLLPQMGVSWLVLDTTNTDSPVSDKRVRQALSLTIDREGIAKAIFKGARTADTHVLPTNLWGMNPDAGVKGDIETAKKLLADAGYPDGQNWPKGVTLHCNNIPDDDFGKGVAEAVTGGWKDKLGITVQPECLEYQASEQWWQAQADQKFHMFELGWSVDFPDPHNMYGTGLEAFFPTYSHWKNAEYSDLIKQAVATTDRAKREELYKKAAVIIEDELPVIPYVQRNTAVVYKTWMGGDWFDPSMAFAKFANMEIQPH